MMNLRKTDLIGTDYWAQVAALRRPRVLIQAARHALADYRRERDLRRTLVTPSVPDPVKTMPRLLEEESRLDDLRRTSDAAYDAHRHIAVLTALLAEVQLLPRPVPQLFVVPKAGDRAE